MADRRRHPRHKPNREITGKVKSTMDFRVIDISEGGLQVETRLGLPPATICDLKISALGSELALRAEVRRCRAQLTKTDNGCKVAYRSGLEFVELNDRQKGGISQILANYCETDRDDEARVGVTQGMVVSGALYSV